MRVCSQVLWGLINCIPTAIMGIVAWVYAADGAADDRGAAPPPPPPPARASHLISCARMRAGAQDEITAWLIGVIVTFAIIFAINSSIHSFLVVHYAKHDKARPADRGVIAIRLQHDCDA